MLGVVKAGRLESSCRNALSEGTPPIRAPHSLLNPLCLSLYLPLFPNSCCWVAKWVQV